MSEEETREEAFIFPGGLKPGDIIKIISTKCNERVGCPGLEGRDNDRSCVGMIAVVCSNEPGGETLRKSNSCSGKTLIWKFVEIPGGLMHGCFSVTVKKVTDRETLDWVSFMTLGGRA